MERKVERVPFVGIGGIKRKKAAAYARVSSDKDTMHQSLSAQVSYYSDLIQNRRDWEYAGVYADEGLTGTREDRAEFKRLLADCRAGKVDVVITKSISRFARNTVTLLETVRELKGIGVEVIFEEQGISSLGTEGELLLTLLASFAQAESLSASENRKWQIRKGFEEGRLMELRFMLGYDIDRDGIRINEEKAEIVRGIYRDFLNGASMEGIARELRAKGIKGALGGRITENAVRLILTNEKYTGNALLQKRYVNNHIEKKLVANKGELPMYYAEGTHDAIIDQRTFDRVQEKLAQIKRAYADRAPRRHYPFTSRIRCAKCGANYIRAYNKKPVWMCWTFRRDGRDVCDAKQIPDSILIPICCEVLGTDEFDEALFDARVDYITADTDAESNILTFDMTDGETIVKRWNYPSRSMSWTPELREKARQAAMKKGAKDGKKR